MARTNRNQPLPQAAQPRVNDSTAQRAFDLLFVPLREVVRFLQPYVQPEKWKPLPYVNGWQDIPGTGSVYMRGAYRKDPLGRVWLRGVVRRVSGAATEIAELPDGYRPSRGCLFVVISSTLCRVGVSPEGMVVVEAGGDPANFISLDGVSFDTVNE